MILIHNRLFIIILILILIPPCKSSIIRDPCDNCPDAGIELFKQKKFKEAQASFMKCIACLNNQYPANDSLFYYLYNYVGAACYYLNDFDKATEYYKKTLVYLENFRKESIADKANILNNIADAYMFKGEYDSSEAYYKKNLLLKRKQADTLNYDFARSYINMSALYYRCGKINKALYYSVLAENIINKTEPPDKVKLASLYLNRGNIYFVDKQYDPALIYYNNALNYFTEADSALYQEQLYKVLLNTGSIYFSKKSYAQAINFYKRAINIYQSPNQLERTYICKYLARAYEKTGENLLAERYYKLSVALCPENRPFERIKNMIYYFKFCSVAGEKEYSKALSEQALKLSLDAFGEHHPLTAECYYVIAKCCLINEDFNTASKYFQLALISVSDTSFGSEEICSNPLAENVLSDILFIKILEGKSTALYKAAAGRGDYLQCSYNTIKLLLDVIAHVRNRYLTNESKYYLSENEYDYYNFAIETAYEMYKTTGDSLYLKEAFVYADRSKYITLTESLFNLENKKICRIPDTLIKIENLILKNIGFYRSKLQQENSSGNPDRAKLNLWNDKLFTFNKKLFTLTNYFEKRYPEYYKLKYDTNYIGSVEALQEYLATDNCMVEYSIIDSVIYIFLVTADNFYVHKDTLTGEFFNSLMSIGNSIVSYNPDEHTVQQYDSMVRGLYRLYCTLIKPVGEKLKKKIIVIPCEILSSIPFEGLISHDKKDTVINYSGLEYLIYKYSISYTFTAELIKKEHFINDNSLLAFAPGYEGDINYRGIEANVEEINTIPDDYRIMKFTGKEATKGNFFLFYNKHSIIHLAMHSEANQSNDMLSRLIFYAGSANDGSMYAYELLDMDFKNKIVVLSGCNTGSGKIIKGEGVFSLARAFIMAGSSNVLFTQWELRDITGMNIMKNFYSCLYDGYSLDSALWRAKLKFLENAEPMKAHPAFWANYFHVGNDRALKITNYNSAIIGFGILMVACLLLILYFKFFK